MRLNFLLFHPSASRTRSATDRRKWPTVCVQFVLCLEFFASSKRKEETKPSPAVKLVNGIARTRRMDTHRTAYRRWEKLLRRKQSYILHILRASPGSVVSDRSGGMEEVICRRPDVWWNGCPRADNYSRRGPPRGLSSSAISYRQGCEEMQATNIYIYLRIRCPRCVLNKKWYIVGISVTPDSVYKTEK
jgi:hypothetical protein